MYVYMYLYPHIHTLNIVNIPFRSIYLYTYPDITNILLTCCMYFLIFRSAVKAGVQNKNRNDRHTPIRK